MGFISAYCIFNEVFGAPRFQQVAGIAKGHVIQSFIESNKKFPCLFWEENLIMWQHVFNYLDLQHLITKVFRNLDYKCQQSFWI